MKAVEQFKCGMADLLIRKKKIRNNLSYKFLPQQMEKIQVKEAKL